MIALIRGIVRAD